MLLILGMEFLAMAELFSASEFAFGVGCRPENNLLKKEVSEGGCAMRAERHES